MTFKHFFSVFTFVAVLGFFAWDGYMWLRELRAKEIIYNVNLFELVPADNDIILYTENIRTHETDLSSKDYGKQLTKTIPQWNDISLSDFKEWLIKEGIDSLLLDREIIISMNSQRIQAPLFLFKATGFDAEVFPRFLKSKFRVQDEKVKMEELGVDVHFIPMPNGRFFSYVAQDGYFAGSCDLQQVKNVVKPKQRTDNSFMEISSNSQGIKTSFTLFTRIIETFDEPDLSAWNALDIAFDTSKIIFTGYSKISSKDLLTSFINQLPNGEASVELVPASTVGLTIYNLSNLEAYMSKMKLFPQPEDRFYLKGKQPLSGSQYLLNNFAGKFMSVAFRDSLQRIHRVQNLKMNDTINTEKVFVDEMRKMGEIARTHSEICGKQKQNIYEMVHMGLTELIFGEDFRLCGEKEFVLFTRDHHLLIANSIESLLMYIDQISDDKFQKGIAAKSMEQDFGSDCSGFMWVDLYDSECKDIDEYKLLARQLGFLFPANPWYVGAEWTYENSVLYQNIVLRYKSNTSSQN